LPGCSLGYSLAFSRVDVRDYFLDMARCLTTSNNTTPVATETLRLLTEPAIGKCTR
jgi:hypothetical protein